MSKTIRAKIHNGRIEPLEPLELPEDEEVVVVVPEQGTRPDRFEEAIGACDGLLDFEAFLGNLYARRQVRTRPRTEL